MGFTLNPETQKRIEAYIAMGGYSSADDVVRLALNLLDRAEAHELDSEDIAAVEESEQQIAQGKDLDWKEVSSQLRNKYLSE